MSHASEGSVARPPIRVLIVDDHAVVRQGLALMLDHQGDMTIVGEAGDGKQAIVRTRETDPDVILMDLAMPDVDGITAITRITHEDPSATIIALTTFGDAQRVTSALDAGAVGYLMKDAHPDEIAAAIRTAADGGAPLDPRAARTLLDARRREARTSSPAATSRREPHLTGKQAEVLALVADGQSNRGIARKLGISEKTVKAHLTAVYAALGVTDRVQAAIWFTRRHGNVNDPEAPRPTSP